VFGLTAQTKVFIRAGATDGRYGLEALRGLVIKSMRQEITTGVLFCFANKARNRIRLLWSDGTGFFLATKRIEGSTFNFPKDAAAAKTMTFAQLEAMLRGVHFTRLPNGARLSNRGYRR
jgi:transposase